MKNTAALKTIIIGWTEKTGLELTGRTVGSGFYQKPETRAAWVQRYILYTWRGKPRDISRAEEYVRKHTDPGMIGHRVFTFDLQRRTEKAWQAHRAAIKVALEQAARAHDEKEKGGS